MIPLTVVILLTSVSLSNSQYNLGICRPRMVRGVYNTSVTLKNLEQDGDYTVIYTSGLKQFGHVACAQIGYSYFKSIRSYKFYSYIETDEKAEVEVYQVIEAKPGKLHVKLETNERSDQYIVYHQGGVLLVYWCKHGDDDNYYNNIWMLAVRTIDLGLEQTKKAVLEMLYHEDYRQLIDKDLEESRVEVVHYLELTPCKVSLNSKT